MLANVWRKYNKDDPNTWKEGKEAIFHSIEVTKHGGKQGIVTSKLRDLYIDMGLHEQEQAQGWDKILQATGLDQTGMTGKVDDVRLEAIHRVARARPSVAKALPISLLL